MTDDMTLTRRFRQLLLKRIAKDRGMPVNAIKVLKTERFPMDEWGSVGTIEVEFGYDPIYRSTGYHAVYGFNPLGKVACYLD